MINDIIQHVLKIDYIELCYALIPPAFAFLTLAFSKAENEYFTTQATNLSNSLQASNPNQTINWHDYRDLFISIAKSASALKNHVATLTSGFLSLFITTHKWPDPWRYIMLAIIVGLFFILFRGWAWRIFSLPLNRVSNEYVRKWKWRAGGRAFRKITYAQYFTRLHIIFNSALVLIILAGYLIF